MRPAWAEVDLDAIRANARALAQHVAPAHLCAVVKANGYGHGAVQVAYAALEGGASSLAVAIVEEGIELRSALVKAPVLLLSEPPLDALATAHAYGLTPTLYTPLGVEAAAAAARGAGSPWPVQLKVDTGMHRGGCDPDAAVELARDIAGRPELELEGVWTHFAVADEVEQEEETAAQEAQFVAVLDALHGAGVDPGVVHACNSAAGLTRRPAHGSMVRAGIALYGLRPAAALDPPVPLVPALSLRARVSHVRSLPAGTRLSYGLRYALPAAGLVATVPIGYADGVPRRLSSVGGHVLVGGARRPIAGTVTMDQLLVDCGDSEVAVGDEVVLIGRQGDEEIGAWEWAVALDTIAYEIVCGIGARVPRVYV